LLVRILATYGPDLRYLWRTSDAPGGRTHDWRTVDRRVTRNVESNETEYMFRLEKFNGEEMTILGGAGSGLRLVNRLLKTVAMMDHAEFDAGDRADFVRHAENLLAAFADDSHGGADEGQAS
jgi:hypothetical protein